MPAVSAKQRTFMAICEHHPEAAHGKCPSKKVAHEFAQKPAGGYAHSHKHKPLGSYGGGLKRKYKR